MKKIIVFIYNSFKDPLFQSNLYKYLIEYQKSGEAKLLLITFEQEEYKLSETEKKDITHNLKAVNVKWKPLQWHPGIRKGMDASLAFAYLSYYRLKGYSRIITLGTVAATGVHVTSQLLRMKHFIYQYEPHFKFLVDFNIESGDSYFFRSLLKLEKASAQSAEVIATGTSHMREELKQQTNAKVYTVPSCVDESMFRFSKHDRDDLRGRLNIGDDRIVVVYAGKFGGLYYDEETFQMFSYFKELDSRFYFLVLSPEPKERIKCKFEAVGIDNESYGIHRAEFHEMYKWYSAADIGLVTVPPLPTQKYRSPIKVGEYLCCGLPYIVCEGISEDDIVAKKNNVGVVIERFDEENAKEAYPKMIGLVEEDRDSLRIRCRQAGITYRGFEILNKRMQEALGIF